MGDNDVVVSNQTTKIEAVKNTPAIRKLVIIPVFNEEEELKRLLKDIKEKEPTVDILVVDDGSRDSSAQIAREMGVFVAAHPFNMGYGVALQTGYKFAAKNDYDIIIQLDGDNQHDPRFITALCEPIAQGVADVTIGSRFLEGEGYIPPFFRRVGMVIFGKLATLITKTRVTDPTSGFQALSAPAFQYFTNDHFPFDYPDADILILLHRAHFRFQEVPVEMRQNKQGKSMHSGLAPIYYVFKMFLSIAMTLLRDAPPGRVPHAPSTEDHDSPDSPRDSDSDP
jgi:glycosyltransferase involved in cell wall biosynthesis